MKENGEVKKLIRIFGLVDLWKEKFVGLRDLPKYFSPN